MAKSLGPGSQIYLKRTVADLQPVVRTSKPYPLELEDEIALTTPNVLGGRLQVSGLFPVDEISLGNVVISSGNFSTIVIHYTLEVDELQISSPTLLSGQFSSILRTYNSGADELQITQAQPLGGSLSRIVIIYPMEAESISLNPASVIGGSFERN